MSLVLIRKSKGLPIKEVAGRMGIHYSYYSHLENGRRKFNSILVEKLASALGENVSLIAREVSELESKTFTVPSWITSIKIFGISSLKAFENHLSLHPVDENFDLKTSYAEFIQKNIAMSILSEFDANPELARMLKYKLSKVLMR